ncbi:hypothetical protein ACFQL1_20095 [Halomicroarcula sp. GCM10025709]|uniref:hypothetical protein n=1 Tax=Halomicroarcula sp. GCM10025709 TaxID=3252669 RepID=UPI0036205F9C
MPSLVVHYAFVGLLAATLLGAAFDRRSLLLALAVVTFPDIDSFIALFSEVGHRAALTNLVIPAMLAALLVIDLHVREESLIRARWGAYGVRVAWFCVFVYAVGHVLFDAVSGGANLLWPIHDQFYQFRGRLELSTQRGSSRPSSRRARAGVRWGKRRFRWRRAADAQRDGEQQRDPDGHCGRSGPVGDGGRSRRPDLPGRTRGLATVPPRRRDARDRLPVPRRTRPPRGVTAVSDPSCGSWASTHLWALRYLDDSVPPTR